LNSPLIVISYIVIDILLLFVALCGAYRARSVSHSIAFIHGCILSVLDLGRRLGREGHGRKRRLDPSELDLAYGGDLAAGGAVHEFLGGEAVLEGDGGVGWGYFDIGILADTLEKVSVSFERMG
jgi:hypothetical protein